MKRAHWFFGALFLVSTGSQAQWDFDNDGSRIFDMRKNSPKTISITIESVPAARVNAACEARSRKLGNGGFGYEVLACSFWSGGTCHIIVPHRVDMRTIGHEVMHCYQGDWHAQPTPRKR